MNRVSLARQEHGRIDNGKSIMQADDIPTAATPTEARSKAFGDSHQPFETGVSSDSCEPLPRMVPRHRILVIDDNPINCQVAVQTLKNAKCEADFTTCSHQALAMHARQRYDLMLMDCQMPGLDGYQTTARIRSEDAGHIHTIIVGWTSKLDPGERDKCLSAGMDDMLTKPIQPEDAVNLIARWFHLTDLTEPSVTSVHTSDLTHMRQRFGKDFAPLALLYLNDTPERITALEEAVNSDDHDKIASLTHILAGSSYSIGANELAAACRELEVCCNTATVPVFGGHLKKLQDEYAKIESEIRKMLQSTTL